MWLYHTVHALVKGPGGEITRPVVVLTICIGEEISTQNWVVSGPGSLGHTVCFVHSAEIVRESAKLGLREQADKCHKTDYWVAFSLTQLHLSSSTTFS